ncbi:MAG: prepilin peptidase [Myxococcaceae bacterium]
MQTPPPLPLVQTLLVTWVAVLGLVVGSFLNVVIVRLPQGKSLAWPASHCPKCQAPLRWYDNIPLFSWLWLRARCRACQQSISARYPLVEALTGALFGLCAARFGVAYGLLPALVLVTLLTALTFIDLETWLLPFSVTLPGIGLGLLLALPQGWGALRDAVLGGALGFGLFWAMEWVGEKIFKKEALGGGDKYLLALLGVFLSHRALFAIVFLASLQGSIFGILMLMLRGRAGPAAVLPSAPTAPGEPADDWQPGPTNMPFGPWLALAGLEVLLFWEALARFLPEPLAMVLFPMGLGG